MTRLRDIVIDCRHPASLARFWAAALDGYEVAPYDEEALDYLHAQGVFDPEDDPTVLVKGPSGAPSLWFQKVPEPKSAKNRVHLDLVAAEGELERLLSLGASVVERQPEWLVLGDPEGNEFCLFNS